MANDLNRSIKIFIDGSEAIQNVGKVEQSIAKLETRLAKLSTSEANYDEKSKKLKKELEAKNRTLQDYNKKIAETSRVLKNLSGASYNELLSVQQTVRKELRAAIPGTQKYTAALEQNRRVTEALTKAQAAMRVELGCQGTIWGRAAGFVNKYMAIITGLIGTLTGISMTMRKSVKDFAQISEAMAGVKKYTSLTDDEINQLNEDFKKLDTRTPRERLNELAQDAGRLGIESRESILEFVDAANIINIALGKDLGEDAVKNIGKLAQMFGDDKTMGLRGAMLATASAINEVAMNSSAAEPYLVNFMARVAGTGKQAGITQAQLIGFASALDQDMQQLEMSSTAFQKVIMKMYQEPAKFAKIAGEDVKEFTELMKNDANEAVLQFLESLGEKGGLSELSPIFKEMQLDGVRAAGVINNLAANVQKVRSEQALANKAYQEGTSVIKEYNIQNNTVQAGLEKARKKFQEVVYEMGEILAPSMSKLIISSGDLVRALATVVKFLAENERSVKTVVVAIIAYTTATRLSTHWINSSKDAIKKQTLAFKLSVIAQKANHASTLALAAAHHLLHGRLEMAKKAMLLFNAATKTNLIGLAVAAVAALTYGLYRLVTQTKQVKAEIDALNRQAKMWNDITEETNKKLFKQKTEIDMLVSAIHSENLSNEKRLKAIKKLQEIIPEYNAELSKEGKLIRENKAAIDEYLTSLENQIRLEAIKDSAQKIMEEKLNYENKNKKSIEERDELVAKNQFAVEQDPFFIRQKEILDGIINYNQDQIAVLDSDLDFLKSKALDTSLILNGNKGNGGGGGGGGDEDYSKIIKEKLDAEKALYEKYQAEIKALYLAGTDEKLQTEKQLNAELERLQLEHLERSLAIVGENSNEAAQYQNQINDLKIKQQKAFIDEQLNEEKQLYEQQQDDLTKLYVSGKDENLRSEAAYNEAMEQLTMLHLERVLELTGLSAEQRKAIEKQLLDFKVKCMRDEEKERTKRLDKEEKDRKRQADREKERMKEKMETYRQYGQQIGETFGNILAGQEDALKTFADTTIDILFDILGKLIDIEISKTTGVAIGAVSRATAESFAQPDSVATFGASGAARAAILSGLIMAALATAKSALKGLIGKKSSSSGGQPSDSKTATVKVAQWASGRYDVIGQDDDRLYQDVPFIGPAPTGIVRRTSLVSENGSELIVNTEDLSRLQQHINYPLVVQAINDARSGRVPQRAQGNYTAINNESSSAAGNPDGKTDYSEMKNILNELRIILSGLKYLKAYVTLRDIHDAEEIERKSQEPFTRKQS